MADTSSRPPDAPGAPQTPTEPPAPAAPRGDGLRRSPLHEAHVAAGARLAPFGGWAMPVEYDGGGTLAEHAAVREHVGLFDVSHLGTVLVGGTGALAHVDGVLSNSLDRIGAGQAQYTLSLRPDGGIVDDLIVYRVADDDLVLVPNAANAAAVVQALRDGAPDGVEVDDVHADVAVLAVQGPRSDAVMAAVDLPHGHAYMSFVATGGSRQERTVVCRTGYTGERGYEVLVPSDRAPALWDALHRAVVAEGGRPAGLGARDTLRTEMGYPLHGNDIGPDVSPVQAGLGFAVGWTKSHFVGRDAVVAEKEAGPARRAHGLLSLGRGVPRAGMSVYRLAGDALGERVGTTTSGTFSPTLRAGVALALLDTAAGLTADDEVAVDVRGRPLRCRVTRPPFVPSHVRD
ncbi:glycine cleavage system aminomethyltransferase GcvT [Aquipuribacter sp. MA13-6]|uniref:glycine cleavage system aminomethyltransferase GcvT n=1 Tax=unclassified Aquipuribacter TaxID=2635084 RepID=UPI003EE8A2A7